MRAHCFTAAQLGSPDARKALGFAGGTLSPSGHLTTQQSSPGKWQLCGPALSTAAAPILERPWGWGASSGCPLSDMKGLDPTKGQG